MAAAGPFETQGDDGGDRQVIVVPPPPDLRRRRPLASGQRRAFGLAHDDLCHRRHSRTSRQAARPALTWSKADLRPKRRNAGRRRWCIWATLVDPVGRTGAGVVGHPVSISPLQDPSVVVLKGNHDSMFLEFLGNRPGRWSESRYLHPGIGGRATSRLLRPARDRHRPARCTTRRRTQCRKTTARSLFVFFFFSTALGPALLFSPSRGRMPLRSLAGDPAGHLPSRPDRPRRPDVDPRRVFFFDTREHGGVGSCTVTRPVSTVEHTRQPAGHRHRRGLGRPDLGG